MSIGPFNALTPSEIALGWVATEQPIRKSVLKQRAGRLRRVSHRLLVSLGVVVIVGRSIARDPRLKRGPRWDEFHRQFAPWAADRQKDRADAERAIREIFGSGRIVHFPGWYRTQPTPSSALSSPPPQSSP